ncbi:hypothetical protein ACF06X_14345 [Streptomyces sp. NPDC015346]|uniref:hypothetical protein n=1 Tax=Streptomyces sp. NPDC015346 TaxID=3364954 RepID=UPI0036FB40E5
MARENRPGGASRQEPEAPAYPAPTGTGDGSPRKAAPVPAENVGRPVPPPPPPPPVTGATGTPVTPLATSPMSAASSEDRSATGRNGGSRSDAPAVTPVAPRGRSAADPLGRDGRGDANDGRHADGTGPGAGPGGDGRPERLLGDADRARLGERLHHALAGFVDSPRDSVAEAAEVLDEVERELIASLQDRRTALRAGWQGDGDSGDRGADTEQLRLTLRTYREVTERLLGT